MRKNRLTAEARRLRGIMGDENSHRSDASASWTGASLYVCDETDVCRAVRAVAGRLEIKHSVPFRLRRAKNGCPASLPPGKPAS